MVRSNYISSGLQSPRLPQKPSRLCNEQELRANSHASMAQLHRTPRSDEQLSAPPNFRIGLLEADFEGEIISGQDVLEYYATYGHNANISLFFLVIDPEGHGPYDLQV
jgi:hypothetical protein